MDTTVSDHREQRLDAVASDPRDNAELGQMSGSS